MASTDIWYYSRNGERLGPVSELDLINTIARGDVRPEDLVWKEGMAQWAPAGSFAELFPHGPPAQQAQPAPPSTPPPSYVGHIPYGGGTMPGPPVGALDYFTQGPVVYAGFWHRFLAHFIDQLIIAMPFCVISLVVQAGLSAPAAAVGAAPGAVAAPTSADAVSVFFMCGMPLVELVAFWLYYGLQESSTYQATLGKRAVGLYVTDTFGRRITFGRASARYFASILSSLILCIGYIMVAFTERKQGLHDMIADTLVIKRV
jgi:uncharacterized RDD family membrane protein YckC